MAAAPFLSIIVPFYNSAPTCGPLLQQLAQLDGSEEVELIFVDDGSSDRTPALLREFAKQSRAPVQIIGRDRGGPGAARNSGLSQATGKFVWFVDSDDTINLEVVSFAKAAAWPELDLVIWDWDHPNIVQRLAAGPHSTDLGPAPPEVLDPIVCNWFSLAFLQRTRLQFPEFCFYEATPIESFVLPLLLRNYLKVELVAYRANTAAPSVTRTSSPFDPQHYDCLHTIPLGMAFVAQAQLDFAARDRFEAAFIRSFLWYVIRISALPGRSWVRAARVMRQYRDEAKRFRMRLDPLKCHVGRHRSKFVMRFLWLLSALLPSQHRYFQLMREQVWKRDLVWKPPKMPDRYLKPGNVTLRPQSEDVPGMSPRARPDP